MVLFAILIHNYTGFHGFRMNSPLYSAHFEEKELLFMEGAPVVVLGSEEVLIDNEMTEDTFWKDFNGKKLTIIYLFNARGDKG